MNAARQAPTKFNPLNYVIWNIKNSLQDFFNAFDFVVEKLHFTEHYTASATISHKT